MFRLKFIKLNVCVIVFVMLSFGFLLVVDSGPVLAKASPLKLQWSNTYANCTASSLIPLQDGTFILHGSYKIYVEGSGGGSEPARYSGPNFDMKINNAGKIEWLNTDNQTYALVWLRPTSDLGYYLLRTNWGFHGGGRSLLKMDSQGNCEWERMVNLPGQLIAGFTVIEGDGCIISSYQKDAVLGLRNKLEFVMYNVSGDLVWQKTFDNENEDEVYISTMLSDGEGCCYVAGIWRRSGYANLWFAKLGADGETVWSNIYPYVQPSSLWIGPDPLFQANDGSFLLIGALSSDGSWVVKVDCDGDVQWQKQYDVPFVKVVGQGKDGSYLVLSRLGVLGVDAYGEVLWSKPYSECISGVETYLTLNVDDSDMMGVVGVDGNLVLAINYHKEPYGFWVGSFSVVSESLSGDYWWFVVFVGVVVVFVGFLVYFKKRKLFV